MKVVKICKGFLAMCLCIGVVLIPAKVQQDSYVTVAILQQEREVNHYDPIKTNETMFIAKELAVESGRWKLYGKDIISTNINTASGERSYIDNKFKMLESVPLNFQESLLKDALPLDCHPGPEGVLKERHSKFLKALIQYTSEHRRMKSMPSSKILAWHCGKMACTGLADKIKGLTYSLLLAMLSHRRLVIFMDGVHEGKYLHINQIDWRDEQTYEYLNRRQPLNINVTHLVVKTFKLTFRDTANVIETVGSDINYVFISTNALPYELTDPKKWRDKASWMEQEIIRLGLAGLKMEDFKGLMGPVFRYLFKFDDKVLRDLQLAKNTLGLTGPYTALHVRSGFAGMPHEEKRDDSKFAGGSSKWLTCFQFAVSAANRTLGRNSLIFLAADTNAVKDEALQKYPRRFRSLDSKIIHVSHLTQTDSLSPDEEKGVLAVWVELFLLAEASTLVRGRSGFAMLAGYLCGTYRNETIRTDPFTPYSGEQKKRLTTV